MCHPLGLDAVEISFAQVEPDLLEVRCLASCRGRTGVEMESMVGASLAALTVYDMTKGLDKGIRVESVEVLQKSGGKSGEWTSPRAEGGV
jgi:cyclic pyranopterin phosphate synthase